MTDAGKRPLIISDCDEVLLHMVAPFGEWLEETQGIEFRMEGANFAEALRRKDTGERIPQEEMWSVLNDFFDTEMHRQKPIAGAVDAINTLAEKADVVILTNLLDHRADSRTAQLKAVGIDARVFTNQGPKGAAIRAIVEEYRPSRAVFIDDLAVHHESASQDVPDVQRLHFVGEPRLASSVPCAHQAGHAHARIDDWSAALPWLMDWVEQEETR